LLPYSNRSSLANSSHTHWVVLSAQCFSPSWRILHPSSLLSARQSLSLVLPRHRASYSLRACRLTSPAYAPNNQHPSNPNNHPKPPHHLHLIDSIHDPDTNTTTTGNIAGRTPSLAPPLPVPTVGLAPKNSFTISHGLGGTTVPLIVTQTFESMDWSTVIISNLPPVAPPPAYRTETPVPKNLTDLTIPRSDIQARFLPLSVDWRNIGGQNYLASIQVSIIGIST
jgi:hypothetical protein